jgi:plasmid stabilization system protein ParE
VIEWVLYGAWVALEILAVLAAVYLAYRVYRAAEAYAWRWNTAREEERLERIRANLDHIGEGFRLGLEQSGLTEEQVRQVELGGALRYAYQAADLLQPPMSEELVQRKIEECLERGGDYEFWQGDLGIYAVACSEE